MLDSSVFLQNVPCPRCGGNVEVAIKGGLCLCRKCGKEYGKAHRRGEIRSQADFDAFCRRQAVHARP